MRKLVTFVAGTAFGLAMVATCGTREGSMLDDMGEVVGDLLGLDLSGAKDAAAAPPLSGNCDKTWKAVNASGSGLVTYYAEIAVPGYDPTSPEHVTVWVCDPNLIDDTGLGTPTEAVFTDWGGIALCPGPNCDPLPTGKCSAAWGYTAGPGMIRVRCGYRSVNGNAFKSGVVWSKAYVKVGP